MDIDNAVFYDNTIEDSDVKSPLISIDNTSNANAQTTTIKNTTFDNMITNSSIIMLKNNLTSNDKLVIGGNVNIVNNTYGIKDDVAILNVAQLDIESDAKVSIYNNKTNTSSRILYLDDDFVINDRASVSIVKNALKRPVIEMGMIRFKDDAVGGNILVKDTANLIVTDNTYDATGIVTETPAAAIYMNEGKEIVIGSGLFIVDRNYTVNSDQPIHINHTYGIYSNNTNGFVVQQEGTKFNSKNRIRQIGFNETDYSRGIVYNDWIPEKVDGWTEKLHDEVFSASIAIHETLKIYDTLHKIVVQFKKHEHKTCGFATTSECQHRGIESHSSEAMNYYPITMLRT